MKILLRDGGIRFHSTIVLDAKETRALEDLYQDVKSEYHEVGEALKERHLAEAALAADAALAHNDGRAKRQGWLDEEIERTAIID